MRLIAPETMKSEATSYSPSVHPSPLEEFKALGFKQCHWVVDTLSMTVNNIGRDFESIFGMSPKIMESNPTGFLGCVHPDDRNSVTAHMQSAIDYGVDLVVRLLDEHDEKWVWLRSFPIENEDLFSGTRMLFVVEDITSSRGRERKQG